MSGWGDYPQMNWDQRMVYDAYGASMSQFNPSQPFNDPPEASTSYQPDADENLIFYQPDVDKGLAERFQDVLKAADQPLYADCRDGLGPGQPARNRIGPLLCGPGPVNRFGPGTGLPARWYSGPGPGPVRAGIYLFFFLKFF
ncbi:unnamed protein product [Cuscuta epithymum]|uniref:Uncharacterized protein n=1 Tax=Cuscuta epithymum TaxID=186058 RepID=A0AAV0FH33_9ASTE|nr:unnamed protein product [Cuscuta epithymum]